MINNLTYDNLLDIYQNKGYKTVFFEELNFTKTKQLILRHDIDFDLLYASKMAENEEKRGIKATYFFMIKSDSYNLFSKKSTDLVKQIHDFGHQISLHFDPTLYNDFRSGFLEEKKLFEDLFEVNINTISLHRPNNFFLGYNAEIVPGIEHTYMEKYIKKIKYISDSGGRFQYDNPIDNQFLNNDENIHLLTHPIWWMFKINDTIDKLNSFIDERVIRYQKHIGENCIPYQNYLKESGFYE